jgi:hypothetical protein
MIIKKLMTTTLISAGLILSASLSAIAADNITTDAMKNASSFSKEAVGDPRVAALSFVEHVNYARIALAMKNTDMALQHLAQARTMALLIKGATEDQRQVMDVQTGRVMYEYDTDYKYHYFPIHTGPVQVKQISGQMWSKNNLAVTDADIVYLTLDLRGEKTETALNDAETSIMANDLKKADGQLAKLVDSVAKVEKKASIPADKAHDNIALARNFISAQNYDGARFALKHADDAMDEMQKDARYKSRSMDLITMRKDVAQLQANITAKDPTMIEKSNETIKKWWRELKSWSTSSK